MAATREELLAFLQSLGMRTVTTDHPALHTVEESRALRGDIPGAHTKNLFLKDKKDALFLVVAAEETPVDLKQLHKAIGAAGRLSFGRAELLMEILGVAPGSVTAFGLLNDAVGRVKVILDRNLMGHAEINCHPLTNTATTTIALPDFLAFLRATGHEPQIAALSGDSAADL